MECVCEECVVRITSGVCLFETTGTFQFPYPVCCMLVWTFPTEHHTAMWLCLSGVRAEDELRSTDLGNGVQLENVKVKSLSRVQLFATPWTVAYQAPPSMGFSRQEHWSGLPFPSPGHLPNPGIEPGSPALEADALTSEPCRCFLIMFPYSLSTTYFSSLSNFNMYLFMVLGSYRMTLILSVWQFWNGEIIKWTEQLLYTGFPFS